ncbi:hypothetical protein PYCC9005_001527 [Savitreella phatthalungensis]
MSAPAEVGRPACVAVGERVSVGSARGTVGYVGPLPPGGGDGGGVWVGVAWDEASRGKHSGTFDGVSVFEVDVPGSASFIKLDKLNARKDPTTTLLEAVISKYTNRDLQNTTKSSQVEVPGISRTVEVVGFARMQDQYYGDLGRLRVVSVDGWRVVGVGDVEEVRERLPRCEELDLGSNLITDADELVALLVAMPNLTSLKLNGNRLHGLTKTQARSRGMQELGLAATGVSFLEAEKFVQAAGGVRTLDLSENRLATDGLQRVQVRGVTDVILRHNHLTDLAAVLYAFLDAQRIDLTGNLLSTLSVSEDNTVLQGLVLSSNDELPLPLTVESVAELKKLLSLVSLQLPMCGKQEVDDASRANVLAALPQLQVINRSRVTSQERDDARVMLDRHKAGLNERRLEAGSGIASNMVCLQLVIQRASGAPPATCHTKRVLRTSTVRQLKSTCARLAGGAQAASMTLHYREGESDIWLELDDDVAQLKLWDISDGGTVRVLLGDH